jgi:hypothetical protein
MVEIFDDWIKKARRVRCRRLLWPAAPVFAQQAWLVAAVPEVAPAPAR